MRIFKRIKIEQDLLRESGPWEQVINSNNDEWHKAVIAYAEWIKK